MQAINFKDNNFRILTNKVVVKTAMCSSSDYEKHPIQSLQHQAFSILQHRKEELEKELDNLSRKFAIDKVQAFLKEFGSIRANEELYGIYDGTILQNDIIYKNLREYVSKVKYGENSEFVVLVLNLESINIDDGLVYSPDDSKFYLSYSSLEREGSTAHLLNNLIDIEFISKDRKQLIDKYIENMNKRTAEAIRERLEQDLYRIQVCDNILRKD